jgi:spermidine/putrescine transport system permease protein
MGSFLRRHRRIVPYLLLAPGLLWLILFYLLPAFQMLLTSFWSGTLETGYEFALSNITNYTEALTKYSEQFGRSILYGGLATLLTFAISYPLAYTIAFRGGRFKNLLLFLVVAPFFTSFLLRTISWKIILGDTGIVLGPLKAAGLLPDEFRLLATPIAVIFGIAYNFLPFMTLPIYVSLEKIDRSLLEAATDLGDTPFERFWRITLPLSLPGTIAASLLVFIPTVGDYITPSLVGGTSGIMVGNIIQSLFGKANNMPLGAAVSIVMMLVVTAIVCLFLWGVGYRKMKAREA